MTNSQHADEGRPRKDKRGVDLISDALPFGGLWYTEPNDAVEYAKFRSRSRDAVIRVYDESGNVIQTHEHKGDFKEWRACASAFFPFWVDEIGLPFALPRLDKQSHLSQSVLRFA